MAAYSTNMFITYFKTAIRCLLKSKAFSGGKINESAALANPVKILKNE